MASETLKRAARMAVVVALFAPGLAAAEPTAADKETARTLMKHGDAEFAAHNYPAALKDYQAAHAIMQVPSTGISLAKAQIETGQLVEARDTLLHVARSPLQAGEPPAFAKARSEAGPLAAKLAERIPSLTITVEGPPSGAAEVTVDNVAVPAQALGAPRKVNPGTHAVTASAPGFGSLTRTVSVKEAEESRVVLKLLAGAGGGPAVVAKAVPGGGRVHVVSPSEPGSVIVDGRAVGATPLDVPVSPGAHVVEVNYPGGTHEERSVDVAGGKTVEVEFRPALDDALARHRHGANIGFTAGPGFKYFIGQGVTLFGGSAAFTLDIGITPTFEFATGVEAGFYAVDANNNGAEQITAVVPAMLRVRVSPWFIAGAGITGGVALNFNDLARTQINGTFTATYVVGPEWQLVMLGGDKRQYEIGFVQGVHFSAPTEIHQMLAFTYLALD